MELRIKGSERDVTRLFALDLPPEAAERYVTEAGTGEWPLRAGLGATRLRAGFVDAVRITDLGEMPLSQYLIEAHGVAEAEIAPHRAQIDALRGMVVILPAQAFGGEAQVLQVASPLRWIGTFGEVAAARPAPALQSESAKESGGRKPPSDAAMSGRVATIVLLVLFAFVALLVWVAA